MNRERPIIFSAPMVRAILEGRKTQTRRALKHQPCDVKRVFMRGNGMSYVENLYGVEIPHWPCPYGKPGDRLWVRETFSGPYCFEAKLGISARPPSKWGKSSSIHYWADGGPDHGDWTKPRPSIFMPRWASRITLEITGVRVERLQGISEADAEAEGVDFLRHCPDADETLTAKELYFCLWEAINGDDSWGVNPWVWVVEFKRVEK